MNRQDENINSKSNISSPYLNQKNSTNKNSNHLTSKQSSGLKSNTKASNTTNSNSKVISVSLSSTSKKLSNDEFIPPPPSSPYPGSDQTKLESSTKDTSSNTQTKLKRVESGQSNPIISSSSSSTVDISNQMRNESAEEQRLKNKIQYLEEANASLQKAQRELLVQVAHISRQAQDANAILQEERALNKELRKELQMQKETLMKMQQQESETPTNKAKQQEENARESQISSTRRSSTGDASLVSVSTTGRSRSIQDVDELKHELAETKEMLRKLNEDHREALELIVTMGSAFINPSSQQQQQQQQSTTTTSSSTLKKRSSGNVESFPQTPEINYHAYQQDKTDIMTQSLISTPMTFETPSRRARSGSVEGHSTISSTVSSATSLQRSMNRDRINEYYQSIGANLKEASIASTSPAKYIRNQQEKIEKAKIDLKIASQFGGMSIS